eukprot:9175524-Pyramimonas_sp.AAC.2
MQVATSRPRLYRRAVEKGRVRNATQHLAHKSNTRRGSPILFAAAEVKSRVRRSSMMLLVPTSSFTLLGSRP